MISITHHKYIFKITYFFNIVFYYFYFPCQSALEIASLTSAAVMFCSTDAIATMLISKTFFSLSATVSKYEEKREAFYYKILYLLHKMDSNCINLYILITL